MLFNLIEKLKKIKDFRRSQGRRHPLHLVLIIIILGIMLGAVNYKDLRKFTKDNSKTLIRELKIVSKRLPSYGTIRRVIMGVNWQNLLEVFQEWAAEIYPGAEELDWLAIDGKSLRSTLKNSQEQQQNFVMIVSLFSQRTGLVIDLRRIENKQDSEIRAAQDLVRNCDQNKKVFTLDALHCNQQLTRTVIEKNNDYLIPVKKNNIKLYQQIVEVTKREKPLSIDEKYERSHGRTIIRKVSVFANPNIQHKSSKNLKSIIQVERVGFRGLKPYQQIVYYLSSVSKSAEIMAEKIKGHWGIENQLHWVKDVIFQEDSLLITDFQAATNFSILITIAMNFFRSLGFFSIKEGQDWLGNKWYKLLI